MLEDVNLQFYEIQECGYHDPDTGQHRFGGIDQLLPDLASWIAHANKPLQHTRTFVPTGHGSHLSVYCAGIYQHNRPRDYLLVTWNETPSTDGQTASIRGDTTVANATVEMTDVPDGTIPGYATYFWILPQHNLIASIRFQHATRGHPGLALYLRGYLQAFASYVVTAVPPQAGQMNVEVQGYRMRANDPPEQLRAVFKSALKRRPGVVSQILARRAEIRRVIRRQTVKANVPQDLDLVQRMLRRMGIQHPGENYVDVRYENRVDFTPSEAQLRTIIESWQAAHELRWDDVGFEFTGGSNPLWLSRAIFRADLQIDVERHNAELVDGQALLTALMAHRADVLRPILNPQQ